MSRYELIWAEHAAEQFDTLSAAARQAVLTVITEIQRDPLGRGTYDKTADRYAADINHEGISGLIVYIVGDRHLRIVVLRVTVLK
ncbi:MAG: hypothetical protein GEU98_02345 [Pseudonocardiaceae bacterium]|nr:hypothetical protein [Pseudonocardiaceae bacterium]